ncbi:MAG: site-specific DNA-methyltransferase [Candidatus Riflebacteria bacterium]|nr:site-specific DNA-methyltransferase [Candidatus Riflebacteria bacterium]
MSKQLEKIDRKSLEISAEKRAKLKQVFPSVFTETLSENGKLLESIDFEKLKAELGVFSDLYESRRERYGMDWPGKKESLRLIQTPSCATLKPCREESVDFDTAENLFIEGDNLEVLKLLQKSYYGKVKMIYIDPPYNTGKEFIYSDNYTESLEFYLQYAGLVNSEGKKLSANIANEGRFHTKWLNMMYPRLYLARNLLRDDGVIFISIDDNEVNNLRKLCDEIFGEENFESSIIVQSNKRGQTYKEIAKTHEYILVYSKTSEAEIGEIEKSVEALPFEDSIGKYDLWELRNRNPKFGKHNRPNLFFPIYISPVELDESGFNKVSSKKQGTYKIEVFPKNSEGEDGCWRWGISKLSSEDLSSTTPTVIAKQKRNGEWNIYQKSRKSSAKAKSIWNDTGVISEQGTIQLGELGLSTFFDHPKPLDLIKKTLQIGMSESDVVLDFFAGSGTTAHAVLELNEQDKGKRKFILVQIPEPCPRESKAFNAGYQTIADIAKERIKRVIKRLTKNESPKNSRNKKTLNQLEFCQKELAQSQNKDPLSLGFRVFKLDKSNFKQWQKLSPLTSAEKIVEQLEFSVDNIDDKATLETLLYEILLKGGFGISEKIEIKAFGGKNVFTLANGNFLFCLEKKITQNLIDAVAKAEPMEFVCLDSAFEGNDLLKINALQTFAVHNKLKGKRKQIIFKTV